MYPEHQQQPAIRNYENFYEQAVNPEQQPNLPNHN